MSRITEQFIDKTIAEIGQSGKPYYYNFPLGLDIDRKARGIMKAVNNFLKLHQRLTGKAISSLEQLKQLLNRGTNLWNSESLFDATVRRKEQLKEEQDFGMKRDKPLPFFGVDLTELEQ